MRLNKYQGALNRDWKSLVLSPLYMSKNTAVMQIRLQKVSSANKTSNTFKSNNETLCTLPLAKGFLIVWNSIFSFFSPYYFTFRRLILIVSFCSQRLKILPVDTESKCRARNITFWLPLKLVSYLSVTRTYHILFWNPLIHMSNFPWSPFKHWKDRQH